MDVDKLLFQQWRQERQTQLRRDVRDMRVGVPFGERMRDLRWVLGMTQRQLAGALGVSVRTVIRHERGQSHRAWGTNLAVGLRELELARAEKMVVYLARTASGKEWWFDPSRHAAIARFEQKQDERI